jgi:hypothetical protein
MTTLTVGSTAELVTALKSTAKDGDNILLKPGSYGFLQLQAIRFTGAGVVIAAQDPKNPPVFAGFEIGGYTKATQYCQGLTFQDIAWGVNLTRIVGVGKVLYSTNINFFRGTASNPTPNAGYSGIGFIGCSQCEINGVEVFNVGTGIQLTYCTFMKVLKNRLHDMYGDGIKGTGSTDITVDGNFLTDFYPKAGDHPDAIQFFTAGTTVANARLTITNNVFTRGKGGIVQGIFCSEEIGLKYQNVTIKHNFLLGTMYNGIAINNAANVDISDNTVLSQMEPDGSKTMPTSIVVNYVTDLTLKGNTGALIERTAPAGTYTKSGNNFTPPWASYGSSAELNAWLGITPVPAPPPPSPPPPAPPPPTSPPPPPPPAPDYKALYDAKVVELTALQSKYDTDTAVLNTQIGALNTAVKNYGNLLADKDDDRNGMVAAQMAINNAGIELKAAYDVLTEKLGSNPVTS